MKKVIIIAAALLTLTGAQAVNKEIGLTVGNWLGLTYKHFITDNFAVQTDLGWGVEATRGKIVLDGNSQKMALSNCWNFSMAPNALYHIFLSEGVYVYGGGGVSLGMGGKFDVYDILGQFGVNATLGAGYDIANSPFTLSIDFRPGYGLGFGKIEDMNALAHFFDWKLALGIRYRF